MERPFDEEHSAHRLASDPTHHHLGRTREGRRPEFPVPPKRVLLMSFEPSSSCRRSHRLRTSEQAKDFQLTSQSKAGFAVDSTMSNKAGGFSLEPTVSVRSEPGDQFSGPISIWILLSQQGEESGYVAMGVSWHVWRADTGTMTTRV